MLSLLWVVHKPIRWKCTINASPVTAAEGPAATVAERRPFTPLLRYCAAVTPTPTSPASTTATASIATPRYVAKPVDGSGLWWTRWCGWPPTVS